MPYKYIGRTNNFKGKTLWEIVGNLKNFGVGRLVTRSTYKTYPEPTYFKILKIETLPSPAKPTLDNQRLVKVLVERTFRGQTHPTPITLKSITYKADFLLIPKDEEAEFCKSTVTVDKKERILPRTMELPPLLKASILRDLQKDGKPAENLDIEVVYQKGRESRYRVAKEGEKPNVEITLGLGKPVSPNLFKGIDL